MRQRRLAPGVLAVVAVLAVCVALTADERKKVSQSAAQFYKRAQSRINEQKYDDAKAMLRKALAKYPDSGVFVSGVLTEPYYPHYLLGVLHMDLEEYDVAIQEFELEQAQGQIQQAPMLYEALTLRLARARRTDNQDPVIQRARADVLETVLEPDREIADVRFSGVVVDTGGVGSLTIDGKEIQFRPSDDGFSFDEVLTLDPVKNDVTMVVSDIAGNSSRRNLHVDLPPLDLGPSVEGVHAVIVGVNRYENATGKAGEPGECPQQANTCSDPSAFKCYDLLDLRAAAEDAERFHHFLVRRGVPKENLTLLLSTQEDAAATVGRVHAALDKLSHAHGDTAIFYFAGHGVNSKRQKNLMLVADTELWECNDTPVEEETTIEKTSIGVNTVEQALMHADFAATYVIIDACRTPRLASARSIGGESPAGFGKRGLHVVDPELEAVPKQFAPVVFYATFDKSVSVEWNVKKAGYFTWYLLQGMRRDMSLWELKAFVQDNVQTRTKQDHGLTQKPHVVLPERLENDYALQRQTYILGHPDAR